MKISFVGAGRVGSTSAFHITMKELADEIVLIDLNEQLAEGEALDILHSTPFAKKTHVYAGDFKALDGSSIVIVSAGAAQKKGETRLDLIFKNAKIVKEITQEISKYAPDSIILMLTNPVDILSYVAWKISGFESQKVIGTGTALDTARLRTLIAQNFNVSPSNIHVYVIGEHGDSEVPIWSSATIGGVPTKKFCESCEKKPCDDLLNLFFNQTKNAAYEIISKKGSTFYAIAAVTGNIVEAIVKDEKRIMTVSTLLDDLYIGYPVIIGKEGINRQIELEISEGEKDMFEKSKGILRAYINEIEKILL